MSEGVRYPIRVFQARTYELNVIWQDPSGNPVNLTGYTVKMQVRQYPGSPVVMSALSTDGTIVLTNNTGNIAIKVPPSGTNIPTGTYEYDLVAYAPNNIDEYPLAFGPVTIIPAVTQP